MSKKSTTTWKRNAVKEFGVLGNQSIFLLLLFIVNAYSDVSILRNPPFSDVLESTYSQKKVSRAHTESDH